MKRTIIFGPPGTGKTTRLLQLMDQEIMDGVEPQRIAFVSFTKSAVNEAMSRAMTKFGFTRRQLPWFRTLHSLAFQAIGMEPSAMLTDYSDFSSTTGVRFSKYRGEESLSNDAPDGDLFLSARSLCAATGKTFADIQRFYGINMSLFRFDRLSMLLDDYKKQTDKLEYHDLLTRFLSSGAPLPVEVAIVDEAQDLTPQQWLAVELAFRNVQRMYIAGDDDQAIYEWAGADAERMLKIPGEQIVLDHSYRLPQNMKEFATQISARIQHRKQKSWDGTDREGDIRHYFSWLDLDFENGDDWLLLVRANCYMGNLAEILEQKGIAYTWHGVPSIKPEQARLFTEFKELVDGKPLKGSKILRLLEESHTPKNFSVRPGEMYSIGAPGFDSVRWLARWPQQRTQYFHRVWARQESLDVKSSVDLTTIHRAKGTEADHVVLATDITAAISARLGDAEHRVFYVGVTRAKMSLFMLKPCQEHYYHIPESARKSLI